MGSFSFNSPKMGKSTITVLIALIALYFADPNESCVFFWISVVFALLAAFLHLSVLVKYTLDFIFGDKKNKLMETDYDKILSTVIEVLKATKGK